MLNYFDSSSEFVLESGQSLPSLRLAYHTFGKLNDKKIMLFGFVMPLQQIAIRWNGGIFW